MNKPPKSGLAFDANFEHPTWKGKSITMCFRVLADTNNCKWMHVSQSDEGVNASTPTYM